MRPRRVLLIIAIALSACRAVQSTAPHPAQALVGNLARLRAALDSIADAPAFRNANWGILAVTGEGDTLYSRNAAKLFMPASNMKLLTTSVALTRLGPDFRYRTTLVADGPVVNGRLDGDLAVIGRGDPSVSDHAQQDAMLPLRAMADSLYARGIRTISGHVVASGDAFPDPVLGFGWAWDDLEASYSAPTDELLFNEGFSTLIVRAGASPGDSVRVETRPAKTFPVVRVMARTVGRSMGRTAEDSTPRPVVRVEKDSVTGAVMVLGALAVGDSSVLVVTHHDPDGAYVDALVEAIRDRGIHVEERSTAPGGLVRRDTPSDQGHRDTLVAFDSPPLRALLPLLLKPSQNQMAEMVFKTVGLEGGRAGTATEARKVIEAQLRDWGADADGYVVRDGSGLSRYDYISPQTIVRVLDAMRRSPNFSLFYESLPIAAVDGTLRTRLAGTIAAQNLHGKTGSVSQARSLSGYVRAANGQMIMFSALANNWTTPARDVEHAQDSIAVRLASYRGR